MGKGLTSSILSTVSCIPWRAVVSRRGGLSRRSYNEGGSLRRTQGDEGGSLLT
jgi:hypothetical protein